MKETGQMICEKMLWDETNGATITEKLQQIKWIPRKSQTCEKLFQILVDYHIRAPDTAAYYKEVIGEADKYEQKQKQKKNKKNGFGTTHKPTQQPASKYSCSYLSAQNLDVSSSKHLA